jgi:hypothetical protein
MIKGCRKNMIHINSIGSPYFEEAYFVVRPGKCDNLSENDIVREASRIAGITGESFKKGRLTRNRLCSTYFLYGASIISFLFGLYMLLNG